MCRMMAVTNFKFDTHKEIIDNFFMLSRTGMVPPNNKPGHLDGWGIGWYKNGKSNVIKSGSSIIKDKNKFCIALRGIGSSKMLMIHLRKAAWDRSSKEEHAHPFVFKNYIFSHNGTILDYSELLAAIPKPFLPGCGALDTEIFFRYLIKGFPAGFKKSINRIITRNKYSSLSFLMSAKNKLFAYRLYSKWQDYYTLYKARSGKSTIISSEPVLDTLSWKLLKPGTLEKIPY